jgi:hypothetical protein
MKTAFTLFIGIFIVIGIGLYCSAVTERPIKPSNSPVEGITAPDVIDIKPQKVPMSVRELQTFLNDQPDPWKRYVCKIDGIWGKETETALENYLCDQNAKECFK